MNQAILSLQREMLMGSNLLTPTNHRAFALGRSFFKNFERPSIYLHEGPIVLSVRESAFLHTKVIQADAKAPKVFTEFGKRIDASKVLLSIVDCTIVNSTDSEFGGGISAQNCNLSILRTVLDHCSATYGGGVYTVETAFSMVNDTQIKCCTASRFGGGYVHCRNKNENILFTSTNLTENSGCKSVGGLRIENAKGTILSSAFDSNKAERYGALFDWNRPQAALSIDSTLFLNNSCSSPGGGITVFHWMAHLFLRNCRFVRNASPAPCSVYAYSTEIEVSLVRCIFTGLRGIEIGSKYNEALFNVTDCLFRFEDAKDRSHSKSD